MPFFATVCARRFQELLGTDTSSTMQAFIKRFVNYEARSNLAKPLPGESQIQYSQNEGEMGVVLYIIAPLCVYVVMLTLNIPWWSKLIGSPPPIRRVPSPALRRRVVPYNQSIFTLLSVTESRFDTPGKRSMSPALYLCLLASVFSINDGSNFRSDL